MSTTDVDEIWFAHKLRPSEQMRNRKWYCFDLDVISLYQDGGRGRSIHLRTSVKQPAMASEPVAVLYLQLAQLRISGRTAMQQWTNLSFHSLIPIKYKDGLVGKTAAGSA